MLEYKFRHQLESLSPAIQGSMLLLLSDVSARIVRNFPPEQI